MNDSPPRWAERLLAWAVRRFPSGRYLLADLREEHADLCLTDPRAAGGWYWRQALALAWRYRLSRAPSTPFVPDPSGSNSQGDLMRTDLVLAVRSIAKRPLLSSAVVLTIGGALAATSIAFSLVDGILLKPLPYDTPDRLVTIWERSPQPDGDKNVVSPVNFDTWRRQLTTVEDLAAVFETSVALNGDGDPAQVGVVYSAGPLFSLIGGSPLVGRYYGKEEDVDGGPSVAVISERLWRTRFGADPSVIGRSILVNGVGRQVIGVLRSELDFAPSRSWGGVGSRDLYIPLQFPPNAWTAGGRYLQVVGRLRAGATLPNLRDESAALAQRLEVEFPQRQTGWSVNPVTLRDEVVGDVETPLAIVFAAVAVVLLIACANVANLLMVRAAERRTELAVRAALGAGRFDLARQVFGESILLAVLGGLVGVLFSAWGLSALVASAPDLPRIEHLGLDGRLLGFLALGTVVVAALIGTGPAVETTGRDPGGWLTQRGGVGDRRATRARQLLVGIQVALSVVLVIGAGVLVRSLANRFTVDLGFDPANVLTAQLNLPGDKYADQGFRAATFESLLERIVTMPGVTGASVASIVPMSDKGQATRFTVDNRPRPAPGEAPVADVRFVHHDYFAAMRIGLKAGRLLEEADRPGVPVAVVINETGAAQLWPNASAVGQRITMEWGDTLRAEIVGVVDDVRLRGPDEGASRTTLYWEYRQTGVPTSMSLVVRGNGAVPDIGPIRRLVAEIDPALPLYGVSSMERLRADTVAQSRFITFALALFSALALGLAALGVYGVMAHGVQQRSREIGVRLALGAERGAVVRMLLGEAARVVGPGLAIGLVAALGLSRFLRTLVFGVTPSDPVTVVAGLALITGVALLACWLPARRGSAIPPAEAIRSD